MFFVCSEAKEVKVIRYCFSENNMFDPHSNQVRSPDTLIPRCFLLRKFLVRETNATLQTKNTGNLPVHSQNVRVYREVTGVFQECTGGLPDFFTLLKLQFFITPSFDTKKPRSVRVAIW